MTWKRTRGPGRTRLLPVRGRTREHERIRRETKVFGQVQAGVTEAHHPQFLPTSLSPHRLSEAVSRAPLHPMRASIWVASAQSGERK